MYETEGIVAYHTGKRAVSAFHDYTLKVWNLETGTLVATFHCDAHVRWCSFTSKHEIIAGDDGGHLHFLRA
jgi:WD40 repeat protein